MEKRQYLDFFNRSEHQKPNTTAFGRSQKKIKSNQKNKGKNQSAYLNSKKQIKPLPHINEEYQYKITNQLLLFKIMNPKRDKLIVESFHHSCSRPQTKIKHRKQNSSFDRPIIKNNFQFQEEEWTNPGSYTVTPHQKLKQSIVMNRTNNAKSSKSYAKEFNIILQNQRMGKRIVNTKSSVQESLKKTFYTYKHQTKENSPNSRVVKNSSFNVHNRTNCYLYANKINNGVKVFFNQVVDEESVNKTHESCCTQRKQITLQETSPKIQNTLKPNSITIYENSSPANKDYRSQFDQTKSILVPSSINRGNLKTSQQVKRITKQSFQNSRILQSLHLKQESQNKCLNNCDMQFQTHYPESFKLFGYGPTILMIYNLQIKCNPKLKDDSLLLFELITHERRINLFNTKQKTIRTTPICYDYLRQQNQNNPNKCLNCLKFCINVSQIGDFIPLRVYKINGVQLQELGIIDIDLSPYKYRKMDFNDAQSQHPRIQNTSPKLNKNSKFGQQKQQDTNNNIIKQIRLNQEGHKLQRQVFYGKISTKLRKRRLNQVDIEVSMLYKVYSKKFKNVDVDAEQMN